MERLGELTRNAKHDDHQCTPRHLSDPPCTSVTLRGSRFIGRVIFMETLGGALLHRELTGRILKCAVEVHRALGPGLLESAYRICLVRELELSGVSTVPEVPIPLVYKGVAVESAYRADLIVDGKVLVELKATDKLLPIHDAQLLTYLRLCDLRVGLLLDFNVTRLREGIRRFIR